MASIHCTRGRRVRSPRTALVRRICAAWALCLALPLAADAAEFTGTISSAGSSQITVDRGGDEVTFQRDSGVEVSGARTSWSALRSGDSVSVSWKFEDKPPRAYRVVVLKANGR